MNEKPVISRNDAVAEYPSLIEGKTIYEWNGQLWAGTYTAKGYSRGIELTPLADEDREYLVKRNALPKIHS